MSKNRVERLESTVAELEATVQGLTEELVETKEQVRALEGALEADLPNAGRSSESNPRSTPIENGKVEADKASEPKEGDRESGEAERADDIIVA